MLEFRQPPIRLSSACCAFFVSNLVSWFFSDVFSFKFVSCVSRCSHWRFVSSLPLHLICKPFFGPFIPFIVIIMPVHRPFINPFDSLFAFPSAHPFFSRPMRLFVSLSDRGLFLSAHPFVALPMRLLAFLLSCRSSADLCTRSHSRKSKTAHLFCHNVYTFPV